MFKRPGQSLMSLAKFIFWIIPIIAIIFGIAFAEVSRGVSVVLFVLAGILIGYLSSICLYAFGSQVENTQKIAELLYQKEGKTLEDDETEVRYMYYCPKCHSVYSNTYVGASMKCSDCKTKLYSTGYTKDEWSKLTDTEKEDKKALWDEEVKRK